MRVWARGCRAGPASGQPRCLPQRARRVARTMNAVAAVNASPRRVAAGAGLWSTSATWALPEVEDGSADVVPKSSKAPFGDAVGVGVALGDFAVFGAAFAAEGVGFAAEGDGFADGGVGDAVRGAAEGRGDGAVGWAVGVGAGFEALGEGAVPYLAKFWTPQVVPFTVTKAMPTSV